MVINWIVTAPALGEGRIYLASQEGKVYALERDSGRELWTHDAGMALAAAPLFDRGTVYVAGFNNQLVALRALDGRPRWACALGEAIELCSPVFLDGTVYLAGRGGNVFAVDAERGTLRWKERVGRLFRGGMTAADGLVCAADSSGIYGLDASTGSTRWTIAEGAQSPVYAAGLIFCVTHVGVLLVIEPANGAILERHDVAGICFFSHPRVEDGYVLVPAGSDSAGSLMCFELKPPGQ
jgi:outer membrane protein assembly factor BamB